MKENSKVSKNTKRLGSQKSKKTPVRSKDIPVTQAMLYKVRNDLKHDNFSIRHEMNARFKEVDARFNQVDARFNQVDARFEKLESKMEEVLSAVHRVGLLVEEQDARNKYVLDGYAQLYEQINKRKNV